MTIEKIRILGATGVWVGMGIACVAILLQLRHPEPVWLSVQALALAGNALMAWRAHALAADDAARNGRLVAERLMAETMLRKLAAAELVDMSVSSEEDATARRH